MTTGHSLLPRLWDWAFGKIPRTGILLAVALFAWSVAAGSAYAQTGTIKTIGQLRVIALRIQFEPDAPPRAPVGQTQLPQLPATRFQRQHDSQYFRDAMTRVRAYFQEVSLGKLDMVTTIGPVVSERDYDKDAAYYGDDANQVTRQGDLIRRAIALSQNAVDFSQYDLIIVFQAGQGQESDLTDQNPNLILSTGMMGPFTASNTNFPGAVLQSAWEMPPAAGEQFSIVGRLCLGIASVIGPGAMRTGTGQGMPNDNSYVGVWDLMDRGWMMGQTLTRSSRTDWSSPAHMNPYEKARMGWLSPILLRSNTPNAEIQQVETTGMVYRLWKQGLGGSEYFLVENRQKVGFDGYLPDSGLLIWQINESALNQSNPQSLRVRLIQSDGRQDIDNQQNYGDVSDAFPGQLSVSTIDDSTTPALRDAAGASAGVSITEISNSSQNMHANFYIVPPMILSFKPSANFSTESVTPTFRASFGSTIEPNTITLVVDGNTVIDKGNIGTYYNGSSRELVYRSKQLAFGQHLINLSVQDPTKTVSESTGDMTFRVNFRTVPAGLRMVSVPYRLQSPDNSPATVFGSGSIRLARWSTANGRYVYYPESDEAGLDPPASDPSRAIANAPAGLAYWINLTTDSPVRINGDQIEEEAYRIPLQVGWNMIGDPFPFPVDWNGVQVEYQGQTKTLLEAVDAEWMTAALYNYQPGGYTWVTAPAGQLQPWDGYWCKAKVACTIIVPPIVSGIGSLSDNSARSVDPLKVDGWRVRVLARAASGSADTYNFIGVSRAARDGADNADVEKPPVPSGGIVSLSLIQGGRSLTQDLRGPEIGTGKTWEFEVNTDLQHEQITLQWPDLSQVPSGNEVHLEDMATGRRVYARTRGGYSYNSGEGGTRRFKLIVEPRQTAPLAVTNLSVERTRGVPSIHFTINREASVTVAMIDPTGKVKRELATSQPAVSGVNVISTGRSDGLTPGIYFVQITATASDGAAFRAVRPLVVVR